MTRTAFVTSEATAAYDLGDEHPLSPLRRLLAVDLMRAYGLLDWPGVYTVEPQPATQAQIERSHAAAYVKAVQRMSANPMLAHGFEAAQWGLSPGGDTPAFPGMYDAAALVCGASIAAAMEVWEGRADQAFSAGGGLHHAKRAKAGGWCALNDLAVAGTKLMHAQSDR